MSSVMLTETSNTNVAAPTDDVVPSIESIDGPAVTTTTTTTTTSSSSDVNDMTTTMNGNLVLADGGAMLSSLSSPTETRKDVLPVVSCRTDNDTVQPCNSESLAIMESSVLHDRSQEVTSFIKSCDMPKQEALDTITSKHDDIDRDDDHDDDDENKEEEVDDGRIRLGICAMDKKARSKPMAEILSRIDEDTYQVVFFGDTVLLQDPPSSWPKCDVLIAFYSKGYPLQKVKEYVKIYKPYILNDLDMQEVIQDRRRVYDTLEGSGIDVPRHVYLSRDGYQSTGSGDGNGSNDQEVVEHDDYIVVNGVTIQKPFVEKPVNAENHNISIYYPTTAGGGCKKLFRKIGNRSSEFYPDINEVRRDGSYIYEEFVETQGTDVKMYTVGPGKSFFSFTCMACENSH